MKKLPRFRDWVPVGEAAQHLSSRSEKVSEVDVLRRALDGHLTLSVNFKTPTEGLRGKRVLLGEAQLVPHPPWLEKHAESVQEKRVEGVPITAEAVLEVVNWETVPIDSVWDLPMVGSERLAVERRIRHCTGGHPPRLRPGYLADRPLVYRVEVFEYGAVIPSRVYNGAFVNREDGTWCRLHRWKKGVYPDFHNAILGPFGPPRPLRG